MAIANHHAIQRHLLLTVAMASALFLYGCSGDPAPPDTTSPRGDDPEIGPSVTSGEFSRLNGWVWFYTTALSIRFEEIEEMLPDLHRDGVRVIGIYSPYNGDPEKWLGCAPLDFYATAPHSGSLEDFEAMTQKAHDLGMKVVTYFVNIYIDTRSEFFQIAEAQYQAGDRDSHEVSAIRWSETGDDPLPEPAAGPSEWVFSETADAYYWSLWGEGGLDHTLAATREELRRVEAFWLDRGVDGFMWDAAFPDPAFRDLMVEFPLEHAQRDLWITFESTSGDDAAEYVDFGLSSWFNFGDDDSANDYTRIVSGEINVDELESALQVADKARHHGRLTHAWSPWGLPRYEDNQRMLPQEAALLAGAGIAYGAPNFTAQNGWPDDALDGWSQVMTTVNANPALHPASSRVRVPVIGSPRAFAMLRSDGNEQVLAVYNFEPTGTRVTVDLGDLDVVGDVVVDLMTDERTPELVSEQPEIEVDGYGFRFLQIVDE